MTASLRLHPHRATIPPISREEEQPLWSVMIPTFNNGEYLRETLSGVLAQSPGPEAMQIEVVDDCSTSGNPRAVVEELGRGRVTFYQQPQNVGHTRNFETCLKRARGHLVHLLHGDDMVRPGFYQRMEGAFHRYPESGAGFCRYIAVDEHGRVVTSARAEMTASGISRTGC